MLQDRGVRRDQPAQRIVAGNRGGAWPRCGEAERRHLGDPHGNPRRSDGERLAHSPFPGSFAVSSIRGRSSSSSPRATIATSRASRASTCSTASSPTKASCAPAKFCSRASRQVRRVDESRLDHSVRRSDGDAEVGRYFHVVGNRADQRSAYRSRFINRDCTPSAKVGWTN